MQLFSNYIKENKKENQNFNHIIDFTVLQDDIDTEEINRICIDSVKQGYNSICVKPQNVLFFKNNIKRNTNMKISTLIDYPIGKKNIKEKLTEIKIAILDGVDEVDVVINYEKFIKIQDDIISVNIFKNELRDLVSFCHGENSIIIKFIIETDALNNKTIKKLCDISREVGVDYIMTSTGYYNFDKQETLDNKLKKVEYMKNVLKDTVLIKVSGGIKSYEDVLNCIKAGADRIGTSVKIIYY